MRYLVTWDFDSDAATPQVAAREAWDAMRRDCSNANVFIVIDQTTGAGTRVDLAEDTAETVTERARLNDLDKNLSGYNPERHLT